MLIVFFSKPLIKMTQITQSDYLGWVSRRKEGKCVKNSNGGTAGVMVGVMVGVLAVVGVVKMMGK